MNYIRTFLGGEYNVAMLNYKGNKNCAHQYMRACLVHHAYFFDREHEAFYDALNGNYNIYQATTRKRQGKKYKK